MYICMYVYMYVCMYVCWGSEQHLTLRHKVNDEVVSTNNTQRKRSREVHVCGVSVMCVCGVIYV